MKKSLASFSAMHPARAKQAWGNAMLSVDTNVLLDMFRLKNGTANEIMKTLEECAALKKNDTFITNQVMEEFKKHLDVAITYANKNFNEAKKILEEEKHRIKSVSLGKLKSLGIVPEEMISKLEFSTIKEIDSTISTLQNYQNDPEYNQESRLEIVDRLRNIFAEKIVITELPSNQDIQDLIRQGFAPGQKDSKKSNEESQIGDAKIWLGLIEQAKRNKKDVFFITNEKKTDWFIKDKDKILGIRQELREYFFKKTGRSIFIFNINEFNNFYGENIGKKSNKNVEDDLLRVIDKPLNEMENLSYLFKRVDTFKKYSFNIQNDIVKNNSFKNLSPLFKNSQIFRENQSNHINKILGKNSLNKYISSKKEFGKNTQTINLINNYKKLFKMYSHMPHNNDSNVDE